jgi:hypothetical protein
MKSILNIVVAIGVLILGLTRFDVYVAHDMPNFLSPLLVLSRRPSSIEDFLCIIGSLSFYITFTFLLCSWLLARFRRQLIFGSIVSAASSVCFLIYIAKTSGYKNSETYFGAVTAFSILIPSLIVMAAKSEQDGGGQPATRPESK